MRTLIAATLAVAATLTLAACSGGSMNHDSMMGSSGENQPIAPGARTLSVVGTSFEFTPATLEVGAGEPVAIALRSTDVEHDITVEGQGHIVHAEAGETAKGGLTLDDPGTYDFYCSIPGHRKAGMVGTIEVS